MADTEDIEDGTANIPEVDDQSWNTVQPMDEQAQTANSLISAMAASNMTQTPQLPSDGSPAQGGPQSASPVASLIQKLTQDTGQSQNFKANNSIVTRAIANQGQLLPIPGGGGAAGGSNSSSDQSSKILDAIKQLSQSSTSSTGSSGSSSSSSSGSGGVGDILSSVADAALSVVEWIVCTELWRQGKMPTRFYFAGDSTFAAYSEIGKRGYYLWAIPCVRHLRSKPGSRFSKILEMIFLWRAENIAFKKCVKGAKWRIRGALVTSILYPACHVIGFGLYLFRINLDWMQVYAGEKK